MADISSKLALVSATADPCSLQPSASNWLAVASCPEASDVWVAPFSSAVESIPSDRLAVPMITAPSSDPSSVAAARAPPISQKLATTLSEAAAAPRCVRLML